MPPSDCQLRVEFESAEAFEREYLANLANGGVFIPTEEPLELRQRVAVELSLGFRDARVVIQGEVVHQVPPEMAQMGAPAGVAVQFDGPAGTVRTLLEPLRQAAGVEPHRPADSGRRRSPRTPARVPARIEGGQGEVSGHTRNLSQTGVLVAVPGKGARVGERVRLALSHPGSGESMRLDGVVVREVECDGGLSEVAIEFAPGDGDRDELHRFVEGIQTSEHARRLGGIAGDISELGVQNLLQMFANAGSAGTLTLHDGQREGVIGFDRGLLRFARLGPASGLKALVRMLGWTEGTFEFHARLDPVEEMEAPLPLEAALLESVRMLDEEGRLAERLPATAIPRRAAAADAEDSELSKIESAVLDLVAVGFSVERILAVIPEPDPEIHRALLSLLDRGVIAV